MIMETLAGRYSSFSVYFEHPEYVKLVFISCWVENKFLLYNKTNFMEPLIL